MYPPVYQSLDVPAVRALLKTGTGPLRIYPFGQAPQGTELPYVVWSIRGGSPENFLNQTPDIDQLPVRFDVYAAPTIAQGTAKAIAVAKAVRDVVEQYAHITAWIGDGVDPDTKNLRITFIADWWIKRT